MRTRIFAVLLAFVVLATAGFAVPLLSITARERTQQLLLAREADLDHFAALLDQAVTSGDPSALVAEVTRYTAVYGEPIVVVTSWRAPMVETGGMIAADPDVADVIEAALRNQPTRWGGTVHPWSREPVLLARPAGAATRISGAVVLRMRVTPAAAEIGRSWTAVLGGTGLLGLACVGVAVAATRWLVRPLHRLDRAVGRLTAGLPPEPPRLAGPPELRQLTAGFNRMTETVTAALEQQQQLVADTSHQMRNPMTALRLRVDALHPHLPPAAERPYAGALTELDRIESLLDDLLTLASAEHRAGELAVHGDEDVWCDAFAVAEAQVALWGPVAARAGATVSHRGGPGSLHCTPAELAQVLDVVLENAVKYGGNGAHVEVTTADGLLVVEDDGPGLSEAQLGQAQQRFWRASQHSGMPGTGLGLAIVERLVAGRGGVLTLESARPHGLVVRVELP
ncbi:sensor histidine kinase [Cryptosporangium sp. NPDC048952]|uniref:sensor histidine kinase n=1 Tax=Cryptosporangium sp. NPDC048952 TaxID=3363961 RepID=UPI003711BF45